MLQLLRGCGPLPLPGNVWHRQVLPWLPCHWYVPSSAPSSHTTLPLLLHHPPLPPPLLKGLAKLSTLGFLFIGQLVDFVLILVQAVGPADRSSYFVPFYGPILQEVNSSDPYLPISDQQCA